MIPSKRRRRALLSKCIGLLMPACVHAGVAYQLSIRPVDQGSLPSSTAAPLAIVTDYLVEDGKVRVGGQAAKAAYVFKDSVMYVIDRPARTVHVLRHATLRQVIEHYAQAVKQAQVNAANAPADQRSAAEQKAADLQRVSERLLQPVTRTYRVTVRFESVDGRACRVWEEMEASVKHLELCVAPTASVPGGVQILRAMQTLSTFRQGADFAIGVNVGLTQWWPEIAALGGVPLLIREYKYEAVVSEVMLNAMREGVPVIGEFDPPADFALQEGPDYTQWYVR